jgi:hypothetical protein
MNNCCCMLCLLHQVAELQVEIHTGKEAMHKEVKHHKAEAARLHQELAAVLAALGSAKAIVTQALVQQVQQLNLHAADAPALQNVTQELLHTLDWLQRELQHSSELQQQKLQDSAIAPTAAAAVPASQQGSSHSQWEQMQEQVLRLAEQLALTEDSKQELQQQLAAAMEQLDSMTVAAEQQALLQQQLEDQAVVRDGLEAALADAKREVDWVKEQLAAAKQVRYN